VKKTAMVGILLCVFGMAALVGSAQADWYTVKVVATGNTGGLYWLVLTDQGNSVTGAPAFTTQYFQIDQSTLKAKEFYAAALTAFANGGNASVYLTGTTAWNVAFGVGAGPFYAPF
jgi:hypothetical protein